MKEPGSYVHMILVLLLLFKIQFLSFYTKYVLTYVNKKLFFFSFATEFQNNDLINNEYSAID